MENKSSKIVIGFLLAVLIAGGIVILYQWRTIKLFKNQIISGGQSNLQPPSETAKVSAPAYMVEAVRQTLSDNAKDVSGRVTAVSGKVLTVEAEIVDFGKLKDLSEDELSKPAETLPKTKKSFQVTIDDKTEFAGKKPEEISAGDSIKVFANELVYKTGNLTAAKVICPLGGEANKPEQDPRKSVKFVAGRVRQITGNVLSIETVTPDFSKVKAEDIKNMDPKSVPVIKKTYQVSVNGQTEFPDKKLEDIKTGDIVQAFSDNLVSDVSEFTATKIVFLTPPEAPK